MFNREMEKEVLAKDQDELSMDELDNVVGAVPHEIAVIAALKNESLYRKQQIEELKKEKEALEALAKDQDEMSMDELDNVRAGMFRR